MSYNLNILSDDTAGVDVIGTSGVPAALSVADTYVAQAGLTAVAGALPPIPLPVIAPNAKVSIKADIGTTTTCYVRVVRQA